MQHFYVCSYIKRFRKSVRGGLHRSYSEVLFRALILCHFFLHDYASTYVLIYKLLKSGPAKTGPAGPAPTPMFSKCKYESNEQIKAFSDCMEGSVCKAASIKLDV